MIAQVLARALGGFYLLGGVMVLRALRLSSFMDRAFAVLEGRSQTRSKVREALLGLGGVLTSLSGLALVLLHALAVPLMLANVAMQLVWLLVAARWFAPEDEEDRRGRRSTMRASAFFAAATLLVLWLERSGHLAFSSTAFSSAVLAVAACGLFGWQAYALLPPLRASDVRGEPAEAAEDDEIIHAYLPARLHLEPRYYTYALWDADSGQPLDPDLVPIEPVLARRIVDFGLAAGRAFDAGQPGGSRIAAPVTRRELEAEAQAIAALLAAVVGEDNVSWRLPDDDEAWHSLTI